MDIAQIFNLIEMFFWSLLGIILFIRNYGQNSKYKNLSVFLSLVFIVFGISDGVEIYTGAWWVPWWLFLWKALCVTIFAISLLYYIYCEYRLKLLSNKNKNFT